MARPVGIIGNYNIDMIIGSVSEMPRWDTEIMAQRFEQRIAGTAGYMALALHGMEIPSVIISSVGQDEYGRFLLDVLRERGLETAGVVPLADQQTCVGFVVVHQDGVRAIVTVSGAHDHFDWEMYQSRKHLLADCAEIVLCGTYLLPRFSLEESLRAAVELKALGKKIYFDPSWDPHGWQPQTVDKTLALLKHVDVFMPNETEICHLTGKTDWMDALSLVSRFCNEVVVKLGPNGAAVCRNGALTMVEGQSVRPVDTTGAGDVFDMGYLYASRLSLPYAERLRFANRVASLVIAQKDRTAYPTLDQINAQV